MLVSEEIHLQAEASPTFEFFISYSLDEQFTNAESIHTKFYVKKNVGEKGGYFYKNEFKIDPLPEDRSVRNMDVLVKKYIKPLWFAAKIF